MRRGNNPFRIIFKLTEYASKNKTVDSFLQIGTHSRLYDVAPRRYCDHCTYCKDDNNVQRKREKSLDIIT